NRPRSWASVRPAAVPTSKRARNDQRATLEPRSTAMFTTPGAIDLHPFYAWFRAGSYDFSRAMSGFGARSRRACATRQWIPGVLHTPYESPSFSHPLRYLLAADEAVGLVVARDLRGRYGPPWPWPMATLWMIATTVRVELDAHRRDGLLLAHYA